RMALEGPSHFRPQGSHEPYGDVLMPDWGVDDAQRLETRLTDERPAEHGCGKGRRQAGSEFVRPHGSRAPCPDRYFRAGNCRSWRPLMERPPTCETPFRGGNEVRSENQ